MHLLLPYSLTYQWNGVIDLFTGKGFCLYRRRKPKPLIFQFVWLDAIRMDSLVLFLLHCISLATITWLWLKKINKPFIVSFLFDFNLLIFLNFQSLSTKSPLKRKFPKGRRRKGRFRKSSDDKKKRVSSVGEFEFIQKSVLTNLNINRCSLQESW